MLEVNGERGIIRAFRVHEKKKTEQLKMKGMMNTLSETKNKNFGNNKQVSVINGEDEYKFIYHFGPFQVVSDDINTENIVKLKLAYERGFNFVCSMTPKQSFLV